MLSVAGALGSGGNTASPSWLSKCVWQWGRLVTTAGSFGAGHPGGQSPDLAFEFRSLRT